MKLNKRYQVFVRGVLATRTMTQHKAIRLVNDYLKRGIVASWAEELYQEVA
jgi:hypothetical protein